jgi:hypothetical protein
METRSVYLKELPEILKSIQHQNVPVKVYNHSGQWSDHFFQVLEIKVIRDKDYKVAVLILFDPDSADATAIDLKSINMVELKTPIKFAGAEVQEFIIRRQR